MTTTEAGMLMLPSAAMMLFAGPIAGSLGTRFGFRAVLASGAILSAASFGVLVVAHEQVWHFILSGVLLGFGISFAFSSMVNIIVGAVNPRDVGIATGINTVSRTVGGAFGSALVTALLTSEVIPGTPFATEGAYTEAFAISTLGALLALGTALAIPSVRRVRAPARTAAVVEA
jgi:MFS family permease